MGRILAVTSHRGNAILHRVQMMLPGGAIWSVCQQPSTDALGVDLVENTIIFARWQRALLTAYKQISASLLLDVIFDDWTADVCPFIPIQWVCNCILNDFEMTTSGKFFRQIAALAQDQN